MTQPAWRFAVVGFLCATMLSASAWASEDVRFREFDGDRCFVFSLLVPNKTGGGGTIDLPLQLVIDNADEYRTLFDRGGLRQSCDQPDRSKLVPAVDFTKETVLALWRSGACDDVGFKKRVLRDDRLKTVIYAVSPISGSLRACMAPGLESLNLIAVPKIPAGYRVAFENLPG